MGAMTAGPKATAKAGSKRLAEHAKAWVALSMAWAAGYTDVVAWIVLYHVYVSHMTGNTAGFGDDVASGKWISAAKHGWPLIPFIAGLLYSAAATKVARRKGIHSSFSIALATEIFLLIIFVVVGARHFDSGHIVTRSAWLSVLLISLPAAAMGAQTVTVTNINGLRVYTTYLTGSLSKFSEAVIEYLFWVRDRMHTYHPNRLRRVAAVSLRQKSLQHAALTSGLWFSFFAGAICGAALEQRMQMGCLLAPIGVLSAAVLIDLLRPVAAADQPEAADSAH
jgi:uncharacterized membrane protein YoaK (UPF0700 family)